VDSRPSTAFLFVVGAVIFGLIAAAVGFLATVILFVGLAGG
jgi:hypothetical protein